ncbi:diguanylate cyclase [Aeromonas australiensis]|uniref:GGDEF domain-containing protein n=1 Tax=Aeromonas australiensis TaxID=1114880 RepID=UPI001F1E42B5|nr:membrane-associated sensor domain-containing protein [Aeromonas australiensis]MCF3096931.1 diguanylate cyclase [Aeromonas australiensis]
MLSEEQRRAPSTMSAHLDLARRQAISRGMVWFWLLNWLVVLFLAIRHQVYSQAGLASDGALPWHFQSEMGFVMVVLLLLPVVALLCNHLQDRVWLWCAWVVMFAWGSVWTLHIFTIGEVELRGGVSYANGVMRLNLLAALIAFYPDRRVLYAYLSVPLLFGVARLWWLEVDFPQLYLLEVVCTIMALEGGRRMLHRWFELAATREYDNLALLRRLDALAKQDPLTGLANRRHFNIELERCRAHSRSSGAPLALILIDVDYFKRFNDHYGHQAGDVCLREVAQQMMRSVRSEVDLTARYGGEGFVLLLPDADAQSAVAIAQRLQDGLAELQLEHLASEGAKRVTISQGIALLAPAESGEQLLERADQALYRAKESGRNQFCVAE